MLDARPKGVNIWVGDSEGYIGFSVTKSFGEPVKDFHDHLRLDPRVTACNSYCSYESTTIKCPKRLTSWRRGDPRDFANEHGDLIGFGNVPQVPVAKVSEAATLEHILNSYFGNVMIGVPLHRISAAVVCALHSGVSKNMSATLPRLMWICFGATSEF
jgi:hypothetical protein